MGKISLNALLAGALVPAVLAGSPNGAAAKNDKAGAFIGGLAIGGIVGSALSPKKTVVEKVYVPGYQPLPPPAYDQAWAGTFSPAPGVSCYPVQRACYLAGGAYSPQWTWQVYAR